MLTPNITFQTACLFQTRSRPLVSYPMVERAQQQEGGYELLLFFLHSNQPLSSLPPSTVLPPGLRRSWAVFAVVGPRDQPPGASGGAVARGSGDDHASEARGAAAGAPDPVGPVLLRRARGILTQPSHRLQVRLPLTY